MTRISETGNSFPFPIRFRRLENLHIIFWLVKDISWCMLWRPLGILMILPTLFIAIRLTFRTRKLTEEFCHNLAIVCWIAANSYWMISEFFGFDETVIAAGLTGKQFALIPFLSGVCILSWYYLWWKPRNKLQDIATSP
ncbi:MAG: hypothetical protein WKF88_08125 [Ferruginibacter sp.]